MEFFFFLPKKIYFLIVTRAQNLCKLLFIKENQTHAKCKIDYLNKI